MTEETWRALGLAVVGGLPATLTAIAALRKGNTVETKVDQNTAITAATSEKVDVLGDKSDVIHELTNSNFDALKGELAARAAELAISKTEIERLKATVDALAGKDRRR